MRTMLLTILIFLTISVYALDNNSTKIFGQIIVTERDQNNNPKEIELKEIVRGVPFKYARTFKVLNKGLGSRLFQQVHYRIVAYGEIDEDLQGNQALYIKEYEPVVRIFAKISPFKRDENGVITSVALRDYRENRSWSFKVANKGKGRSLLHFVNKNVVAYGTLGWDKKYRSLFNVLDYQLISTVTGTVTKNKENFILKEANSYRNFSLLAENRKLNLDDLIGEKIKAHGALVVHETGKLVFHLVKCEPYGLLNS